MLRWVNARGTPGPRSKVYAATAAGRRRVHGTNVTGTVTSPFQYFVAAML